MLLVDKNFCMSSYCAFRYIEKEGVEFAEGLHHENFVPIPIEDRIAVRSADEIDREFKKFFEALEGRRLGLMLSGGMDSAICAAYMSGADAYTFRYLGGRYQAEETSRAEYYAKTCGLTLHYVEIDWDSIEPCIDPVMKRKGAPVHSIEPQLMLAAVQAKADGVDHMIVGEASDLVFGGMDQLLSKDWTFDEFVRRYTFLEPTEVLNEPVDVNYLFERYRRGDRIDFPAFMDDVFSIESSGSYLNAFATAGLEYSDPYARLKMSEPLDLARVRSGDSKYLIRDLFRMKYPGFPVPEKIPMPRPVDHYFDGWSGPRRAEFKRGLDMKKFGGNQKWQLYCLERFLNLIEA